MTAVQALGHALGLRFGMLWQILWALVLGFGLSGAVEAVVSKEEMSRLLPDDRPRSPAGTTNTDQLGSHVWKPSRDRSPRFGRARAS